MIVPMKKIYLIVQKKDTTSALESLRDLGMVHIEHQKPLTGYQLAEVREEVSILSQVVEVLKAKNLDVHQEKSTDWREECNNVLEWMAEIEHHKEAMLKREVQIKQWTPWGDFEPDDISVLKLKNVFIQLYEIPVKQKFEIPEGVILKEIKSNKKIKRCVVISRDDESLSFERLYPPAMSLAKMRSAQEKDQIKIQELENKIEGKIKYVQFLEKCLVDSQESVNVEEVVAGMDEKDSFVLLKGFFPVDGVKTIEEKAKQESWGIVIEDPSEEDQVPTLLRNPKWVEMIKPVFNVIEVLPGYKEVDVSIVFLLFFTIFFGMLIGDAAYGLIFMAATLFAQFKMGKKIKDKTPFILMYMLTGVTIVWGVLTGTWFGQQWLPESVKPVMPWLVDEINVQHLCFIIALAHLTIARLWAAALKFPSLTFLAELGWLSIIWGMFHLASMFVLGFTFPVYAKYLIFGGMFFAFFFMVPFKEFPKKAPIETIPFLLNVIAAGTDIVSYIRLFAVGLATVAVADAANALPENFGPIAGGIGLVFLHTLNMILAAMAILVHAIRLNVLEFSGHMGLQWAGYKYNPFQTVKKV